MKTRLGNKGFTLMEMMVVVMILGLSAAMAVPYYITQRRQYDLKDAASLIFTNLMLARTQAVQKYTTYTVAFNLTTNTFSVQQGTGAAVTDPNSKKWNDIDIYSDTSDPNEPPFTSSQVIFYKDGSAGFNDNNTGYEAIYIQNTPATGFRYRVSVLGATGKITAEQWKGGTWISGF